MTVFAPFDDFHSLVHAPLHTFDAEQWAAYYPAMAVYLRDPDRGRRERTVERLSTAALWSEWSGSIPRACTASQGRDRVQWLVRQIEAADALHGDVLVMFLRCLRYDGHLDPVRTPLLEWLKALEASPRADLDPAWVTGARLLVEGAGEYEAARVVQWRALLDDRSDWVRGCAAYLLGGVVDDSDRDVDPMRDPMFALIGAKEIERPGIAGPFWSQRSYLPDAGEAVALWMLDLLERRRGPAPQDIAFNDIEFHLHELCCFDPEQVQRMIGGGFFKLALMTATEMYEPVDGMGPVLETLARHEDADIAAAASRHWRRFYSS